MHTKGPAPQLHDGSNLRIGIVHARWNDAIIDPLLAGAKAKLKECGVKESNIVVQTVPGSWELPIAVQRYVHLPQPFPLHGGNRFSLSWCRGLFLTVSSC
jgi:6,7-dimethyl-8-ribityllumazine synthase